MPAAETFAASLKAPADHRAGTIKHTRLGWQDCPAMGNHKSRVFAPMTDYAELLSMLRYTPASMFADEEHEPCLHCDEPAGLSACYRDPDDRLIHRACIRDHEIDRAGG